MKIINFLIARNLYLRHLLITQTVKMHSYPRKFNFSNKETLKVLGPIKDSQLNKATIKTPKFSQMERLKLLSASLKQNLLSPQSLTPKSSLLSTRKSEYFYKMHLFKTYQAAKLIKKIPPDSTEYQSKSVFIPRKAGFEHCKTVIFDLDETLVYTSQKPFSADSIEIRRKCSNNQTAPVWVNIRPFAKECLKEAAQNFEVIVFTASFPYYADSVLDILDPDRCYIHWRLYRDSCVKVNDSYIKDLRILEGRDLKDVIIVDNNAVSFAYQLDNGIPIISWKDDNCDRELFDLAEYLNMLKNTNDIRDLNKEVFKLTSFHEDYLQDHLVGR